MAWMIDAWVFVVAVIVIFLPGMLISFALGARGFHLIALAAPFTVTAVAVGVLANQVLPFRWGALPIAAAAVLVSALTWGVRSLWRKRWADVRGQRLDWGVLVAGIAGLVLAAALIIPRLVIAFGDPSNVSQTFDNVYHLNAVRYIEDGGNASPFQQLIPGFYPDLWHAIVAAIVSVTGATIPLAVNCVSIVLGALVWPLSCMLLVRQIVGARPIAIVVGAVLAAGFGAFPLLMLDYGVLYPNVLSISILPAVFAAVIMVTRLAIHPRLSAPAAWWALLALVPGLALAHPSTLMALIAICVPPAAVAAFRQFQALGRAHAPIWKLIAVAAAWVTGAAAAAALLLRARPTREQAFWPPSDSLLHAVWSTLTNSAAGKPVEFTITALMLVGIVAVFVQRRQMWLVGSFAVIAGLYVVCVSFPVGTLRYGLTGTWYSDSVRLAALLPTVVLPLATVGAVWIYDLALAALSLRLRRSAELGEAVKNRNVNASRYALGTAIVIIIAVLPQVSPSIQDATASAARSYALNDSSVLLSSDEELLLERLGDEVPRDSVIAGSPWTGTSLSYALSDRKALIPHIYSAWDSDIERVVHGLREATEDPGVCEALQRTGVGHVLDFGPQEVHGARHSYPGLENLDQSDAVRLIDSEGSAKLYEVTACRL